MSHNEKPNHLLGQTSPYLKQHLYNPVDWHPWGEEALEKARREDKPILVSVGYSACHWCHVMEKESFEDESVARLMNENFVCIKVDREERPDIDHLYMNAVQLVAGQGGWPLNCFALPDGRPFWGGTYFPKAQWKGILGKIADIYREHRDELLEQAENLTDGIVKHNFIEAGEGEPSIDKADGERIFKSLMEQMDRVEGGLAGAPKFPMPNNFEFLLQYHHRAGHEDALEQTNLTLRKMARGGIYDHIGGGFARYSTDAIWKAPHFEKMLYDNAQLVSLYSNAFKATRDPLFKEIVYGTVEWVAREMTSPDGTFYSALDADSEGEEGKFYTWTAKEFERLLGDHAHIIKDHFGVDGRGRWEDEQNILMRPEDNKAFAKKHELSVDQLARLVEWAREKLFHEREKRPRPGLDDKVLVSWNALMIKGLTDAFAAFGDRRFLEGARRAADNFLANSMDEDGRLTRTFKDGKPAIDGFLEDYAMLADALIALYQATLEESYISKAALLAERAVELFDSPGANLLRFSAARDDQKLAAPHFEYIDNVIPSSNSVMARCLFYLANYFERNDWDERSARMLADIKPQIESYSGHFSNWAILLLHRTESFYTASVCGEGAGKLAAELNSRYLPDTIIAGSEKPTENPPILRGRFDSSGVKIHVCSGSACLPPVDTVEEAIELMRD